MTHFLDIRCHAAKLATVSYLSRNVALALYETGRYDASAKL